MQENAKEIRKRNLTLRGLLVRRTRNHAAIPGSVTSERKSAQTKTHLLRNNLTKYSDWRCKRVGNLCCCFCRQKLLPVTTI